MEKYILKDGFIIKDGHTMFMEDVVMDLNRKAYLEIKFKELTELHRKNESKRRGKKPLAERKEAFRLNTFKYLDRYSEADLNEFFEDCTELANEDQMKFEVDGYSIDFLISLYFN